LIAPASITLLDTATTVTLEYRRELLTNRETVSGVVSGWPSDTMAGPAFRLVNTVVQAVRGSAGFQESSPRPIAAGEERRIFITADSGQPFEVAATTGGRRPLLVALHEPNGMPFRGSDPQIAGAGQERVSFRLDGRDVVAGTYELVAVAPPTESSAAQFDVHGPGVQFDTKREAEGVVARISHGAGHRERQLRFGLIGGERQISISTRGTDTVTTAFVIPAWAHRLVIDLAMTRHQWARFTDFGMTLFDSSGRHIEVEPLDYAFGRLQTTLEPGGAARPVTLRLYPALADPESREPWQATISIRLYAGAEVALSVAQRNGSAPADEESTTFTLPPSPWLLDAGFFPLGVMSVVVNGTAWTREVPLPEPAPPLSR
jgi:hypothetical protein